MSRGNCQRGEKINKQTFVIYLNCLYSILTSLYFYHKWLQVHTLYCSCFFGCVQNTNLFRFMKQSVDIPHGTFHLYLLLPCLNGEDDQHFFILIIIISSSSSSSSSSSLGSLSNHYDDHNDNFKKQ